MGKEIEKETRAGRQGEDGNRNNNTVAATASSYLGGRQHNEPSCCFRTLWPTSSLHIGAVATLATAVCVCMRRAILRDTCKKYCSIDHYYCT